MTFNFKKETLDAIVSADKESTRILKLMKNSALQELFNMEPMQVSGRVMLDICVKLNEDFRKLNKDFRREIAVNAVNIRHNQPGGSRDKQQQIRDIWATGKYSSRDICAEEEYDALGMSFSTARKALRNTPNP